MVERSHVSNKLEFHIDGQHVAVSIRSSWSILRQSAHLPLLLNFNRARASGEKGDARSLRSPSFIEDVVVIFHLPRFFFSSLAGSLCSPMKGTEGKKVGG